jgi:hypothetical protein
MENDMHNIDPYFSRPIEFIDLVNSEGWRIKVYGISADSLPLPKEIVSAGTQFAVSQLPQPAITEHRYGVGFLIIHHGTMRNWILLDWWENEDIIHHKLFSSPLDNPGSISIEPDKSLIACVHEFRIITFESETWIKTVLCKDGDPNFDRYLNTIFNSKEKLHDRLAST